MNHMNRMCAGIRTHRHQTLSVISVLFCIAFYSSYRDGNSVSIHIILAGLRLRLSVVGSGESKLELSGQFGTARFYFADES